MALKLVMISNSEAMKVKKLEKTDCNKNLSKKLFHLKIFFPRKQYLDKVKKF